jgi:hypothetical protein
MWCLSGQGQEFFRLAGQEFSRLAGQVAISVEVVAVVVTAELVLRLLCQH